MQKKQLSVLVLIILCFLLGCNRETPKAVSYTHLDVYKRQVLPRDLIVEKLITYDRPLIENN